MFPDGVQWLKLPVWKVGDRGFEPRSGIQVSKKIFLPCSLVKIQYCGEPPWPKSSVLGISPPGLEFRITCHLINLTISRRCSWSSLAYMCTKETENPSHLISFYFISERGWRPAPQRRTRRPRLWCGLCSGPTAGTLWAEGHVCFFMTLSFSSTQWFYSES